MTARNHSRKALLGSACAAALVLGVQAYAEPSPLPENTATVVSATSIAHTQNFSDFDSNTATVDASNFATLEIDFDDILDSVARIGSRTAGDTNTVTANGFANDASLSIASDLNSDAGLLNGVATASLTTRDDTLPGVDATNATDVTADMSIALSQNANGVDALLLNDSDIDIEADDFVQDSTLSVYGNTAQDTGVLNRAANNIDITVNDTSSTAAIGLGQMASASTLYANNAAEIAVYLDDGVDNSTVELASNTVRSIAVGNAGTNGMTVAGNAIAANPANTQDPSAYFAYGQDTVEGTNTTTAIADATYAIANSQNLVDFSGVANDWDIEELTMAFMEDLPVPQWDADVQAVLDYYGDDTFEVYSDNDITDSSVSLTGNAAVGSARGNDAANSVSLTANSITGTQDGLQDLTAAVVAIANSQNVDSRWISAHSGEATTSVLADIYGDVQNSTLAVDSNAIAVQGVGSTAHNSITVASTEIGGMDDIGSAATSVSTISDYNGTAMADGAFAINSQQTLTFAAVSAALNGYDGLDMDEISNSMLTYVSGDVQDSSASMDGNTLSAAATGNAINSGVGNNIALSGNAIDTTSAISNNQGVGYGGIQATAVLGTIDGAVAYVPPTPAVTSDIDWTVVGSNKVITAVTYAGLTQQQKDLVAALGYTYDAESGTAIAAAGTGDISGHLTTSVPGALISGAIDAIPFAVDWTLSAGQRIISAVDAGALSSEEIAIIEADNWLAGEGGIYYKATGSSTASGTDNYEVPAVPAVYDDPTTLTANWTINGSGDRQISAADVLTLTQAEKDKLGTLGWVYDADTGVMTQSAATLSPEVDSGTLQVTLSPADPGTPGFDGYFTAKGVTQELGGDLLASLMTVDGNTIAATATANTALNSTTVDATTLSGTGDTAHYEDLMNLESADHVVSNSQSAVTAVVAADTEAMFGINTTDPDADLTYRIVDSTVSVSDNTQSATTKVNTATNSESLSGTDVSTSGLVYNLQAVDQIYAHADSTMTVTAPTAATGSTITMDGNTNAATLVVNNSANSLSVDATNLDSFDAMALADMSVTDVEDVLLLDADYLVANNQYGAGTFNASVDTSIYNWEQLHRELLSDQGDYTWAPSSPLFNSTVSVSGNTTVADATINKAINSLDLNADATMTATAGVSNRQDADGIVSSYAWAILGLDQLSDDETLAAVDHSSVTVDNNAIKASAVANYAANSLSVTSLSQGAADEAETGATSGADGSQSVAASYGVLNAQWNEADTSAYADGGFEVNAFDEDHDAALYASSVSVSGNTISATAIGNQATNAITLASLDLGTSSVAISSNQWNDAAITASIGQDYSYSGVYAEDALGSMTSVYGNSLTASATGNKAVSVITRSGNTAGVSNYID